MANDRQLTVADGVSLRDHIDTRLAAMHEYNEARLMAMEKATDTATTQLNNRLEGMNEFRSALKDQTAQMVTRSELVIQLERIDVVLNDLKKYRDQSAGAASQQSVIIAYILAVIGLVTGVLGLLGV